MKNLAKAIFEQYFPEMLNKVDLEIQEPTQHNAKQTCHLRHDPTQRKGKMLAPHAKEFCEACQRGLCYN
jgi:Asp-tRNA(Asn)/Glu-tRNA(Gln) amidotransferase C subunit